VTVAAVDGDPLHGGVLLAVHALGMAVPMFVLALLWDRFDLGRRRWLRGRTFRAGPLTLHSTTLIGGLFFIALGAAFLVFDGTSALPSVLDTDTEFALEERLSDIGAAVSDRVVLLLLAGVAALAALLVLLRPGGRREAQEPPDSGPGAADSAARSRMRT
jgi:hypothetical protein